MKQKLPIALLTFLFGAAAYCQILPSDKGFTAYQIVTQHDTIDFYLYNPKNTTKKNLLVHIDGSYPAPLWIESDPCCVTLDPFNYKLVPEDYAYVVLSKHTFAFSGKEDFKVSRDFWKKNTLDFRVARVNKVIQFIQASLFKPERIAVVGTSQGTDVAAKLATINKDITHLGFWAGGGHTQLMEFILFVRKDAIAGKITEAQAAAKIDALLTQFKAMFDHPSPDQMWEDNSYLSYVSFSEPPVASLLKLDIPIFVAAGTKDENVAVENTYIIPVEFIRHGKNNLTFRHYPGYDHGFSEKANGKEIDHFDEVSSDFFKWLGEH